MLLFKVIILLFASYAAGSGAEIDPPECYHFNIRCHDFKAVSLPRKLQGAVGHVIHEATAGDVPRDDVTAAVQGALNGDSNFVVEVVLDNGMGTLFKDLTRDDMVVSMQVKGDFSAAFTATGPFIKARPNQFYRVECPSEADGSMCSVTLVSSEDKNEPVSCCTEQQGISRDDIPSECKDEDYSVSLRALPSLHFFLVADKQPTSDEDNCPQSISFQFLQGKKVMHVMFHEDIENLPSNNLGTASLRSILNAEEGAAADNSEYDVDTNTCIHYAGSIWRTLGFQETEGLAEFLTDNVLVNDGDTYAKFVVAKRKKSTGARALVGAAIGGKSALKKHLKHVIYSQLNIVGE